MPWSCVQWMIGLAGRGSVVMLDGYGLECCQRSAGTWSAEETDSAMMTKAAAS